MLRCSQAVLQHLVFVLDGHLLALELFDLLALPLPRRLGGLAITEDPLDAPLLFLILGLCAFAKGELVFVEMCIDLGGLQRTEVEDLSSVWGVLDPMTFASSSTSSRPLVPL